MTITKNIPPLSGSHDTLIVEWTHQSATTCTLNILGSNYTIIASPSGSFYIDLSLFVKSEFEKHHLEDSFEYITETTDTRLFKTIEARFTHNGIITTHSWQFFLGTSPVKTLNNLIAYEGYPFDYTYKMNDHTLRRSLPKLRDGMNHHTFETLDETESIHIERRKEQVRLIKFLYCGSWYYIGFEHFEEIPNLKIKTGTKLVKNIDELGATSILDKFENSKTVKAYALMESKYFPLAIAFSKSLKFYEYLGQRFNRDDFTKWRQVDPNIKSPYKTGDKKFNLEVKWKSFI